MERSTVGRLTTALADRYRVDGELGAGGMATVYRAHDLKHERDVAIKVLHPDLGAALGGDRFLSEIRTTARLQHPHILPLLDSGVADGLLYYVMPLVTGETLRARLTRDTQLPLDEALRIAKAVADALAYAHERNVIHRDVKPENILLQDGHALVADFGIALAVQHAGGQRMTQTGLSLGTPQYMSPEQAMGEKQIDGRSDQYAVAAMLYEMLAGDPPFTGSTVQAIVARVLTERPTPLTTLRDTVPEAVDAAITRALAKLPADRFASVRAFAEALEREAPASTTSRSGARSAARSSRGRGLLIAAGVLTLSTVAFAALWWRARTPSVGSLAEVRFDLTLPPGVSIVNDPKPIALTADGSLVAVVGVDRQNVRRIYVRRLSEPRATALANTNGASTLTLSPNGQWLAFATRTDVRKIPITGGEATTLMSLTGQVDGMAWSARDELVVAMAGRLGVVPASGGVWRKLPGNYTPPGRGERYPMFAPDGTTLVYTVWSGIPLEARVMRRTLVEQTPEPVGLDSAVALGFTGSYLLTGTGAALRATKVTADAKLAGSPQQILEGMASALSIPVAGVSASGALVYRPGASLADIVFVRGSDTTVVSDQPRNYNDPRVSPDGRRFVVSELARDGTVLWVMDPAARTAARLTPAARRGSRAAWADSGRTVTFRGLEGDSLSVLWRVPWDGSTPPTVWQRTPGVDIWEGENSPDARWLIVRTGTANAADLFIRPVHGDTALRPLVKTPVTDVEPRISPDGKWLAYTSNESGDFEVYVRPFPDGVGRYQISAGGAQQPVWGPDGRTLHFVAADGEVLVRATLQYGGGITVTARDTLVRHGFHLPAVNGHPTYDVTPDGRLLLIRRIGADDPPIMVLNWLSRLGRAE